MKSCRCFSGWWDQWAITYSDPTQLLKLQMAQVLWTWTWTHSNSVTIFTSLVSIVETFKFLEFTISKDLKLEDNINCILTKTQQSMCGTSCSSWGGLICCLSCGPLSQHGLKQPLNRTRTECRNALKKTGGDPSSQTPLNLDTISYNSSPMADTKELSLPQLPDTCTYKYT